MNRLTQSVPAFIGAAAVLLLPLLAIPFIGVSAELQKGDLAAAGIGIALLIAAVLALVSRTAFAVPLSWNLLLGLPLFLVAVLSALVNQGSLMSWWGVGLEFGTVGSIGVYMLAVAVAGLVLHAPARFLMYLFTAGVTLAGVISVVVNLGGGSEAVSFWPALSAALAAALVCAATLFDQDESLSGARWLLCIESIIMGVCFVLFFNTVFALVAAAVLLCIGLIQVLFYSLKVSTRLPILSGLLACALLTVLFFGIRNPVLHVPPDIRPSLAATQLVTGPLYLKNVQAVLLGSGPNTFSRVWNHNRPTEFNATPLWSTTFEEGYSSAATIAVVLGVAGLLAWIFPLLVLIAWVVRIVSSRAAHNAAREEMDVFWGAVGVVLFYFAASLFYTTGVVLFIITGVMLSFAARALQKPDTQLVRKNSSFIARLPLALVAGVLGAACLALASAQLMSASNHASGYVLFKAGNYSMAHAKFVAAGQFWSTPLLYSDSSRVSFIILENQIASSSSGVAVDPNQVNMPIAESTNAIRMDDKNFDAWLSRSSLYVSLVGNKVGGVDIIASSSLTTAGSLAPNRPEVPYLRAVLAAQLGHAAEARYYLGVTLTLKPDYEPVQRLQAQLEAQSAVPEPLIQEATTTPTGV